MSGILSEMNVKTYKATKKDKWKRYKGMVLKPQIQRQVEYYKHC